MIRVFPYKNKWTPTDELAFIGDPPLFLPPIQPVKISVCFTWDIKEGKRLAEAWSGYYPDVEVGGPAVDDPGNGFVAGRFIKWGVVITSRGCPKRCDFCFVHKREGNIRELPIVEGHIIQDNNLLACSPGHIKSVFAMLSGQKKAAVFSGGLDVDFLQQWHIDLFHTITIKELWFACDHYNAIKKLRSVASLLSAFPAYKKRCYCMIGKNETLGRAKERVETIYSMGFFPFAQLYQPKEKITYSKAWKDLCRKWSRPAAYNRS